MAVIAETRPRLRPANTVVEAQSYESMSFLPEEDRFAWDNSKGRNIVLMGQAKFGADAFNMAMADGHNVTQVYGIKGKNDPLEKAVDKVTEDLNFGDSNTTPPRFFDLKTEIGKNNKDKFANRVRDEENALLVMAFVEEFIPIDVLKAAADVVEYHPSELPEDAGSSSIPFAIAKGKTETALSLLRPGEGKVDTGPLLAIKPTDILEQPTILQPKLVITDWDTPFTLNEVAGGAGISLLRDGLRILALGESEWVDQDLTKRTFDRRATKKTAEINHNAPAREVYNHARAFPHLGTFVRPEYKGVSDTSASDEFKRKYVYSLQDTIFNLGGVITLLDHVYPDRKPGEIAEITEDGVIIPAKDGSIMYSETQVSATIEDQKGIVKEDRNARGKKVSGLANTTEYGLIPGIRMQVSRSPKLV